MLNPLFTLHLLAQPADLSGLCPVEFSKVLIAGLDRIEPPTPTNAAELREYHFGFDALAERIHAVFQVHVDQLPASAAELAHDVTRAAALLGSGACSTALFNVDADFARELKASARQRFISAVDRFLTTWAEANSATPARDLPSQRREIYEGILTCAVEGGSNYWMSKVSRHVDLADDEALAALADDDPIVTVWEGEPGATQEDSCAFQVSRATIAEGFHAVKAHWANRARRKMSGHGAAKRARYWRTAYRDCADGSFDFDVEDADVILQFGLFDEVRYG